MNKRQAVQQFKEDILPIIKNLYEQDGKKDSIARSEAWNNWIDLLVKDGTLPKSAIDWVHPKVC